MFKVNGGGPGGETQILSLTLTCDEFLKGKNCGISCPTIHKIHGEK